MQPNKIQRSHSKLENENSQFILVKKSLHFNRLILDVVFSHSFFVLTLYGNLLITALSYLFFFFEKNRNSSVKSFLDAIWWGFSTATTVGYGDIVPLTLEGKIIGIFLMLSGTAIFAMYTALFAKTIFEDEVLFLKKKSDSNEGRKN